MLCKVEMPAGRVLQHCRRGASLQHVNVSKAHRVRPSQEKRLDDGQVACSRREVQRRVAVRTCIILRSPPPDQLTHVRRTRISVKVTQSHDGLPLGEDCRQGRP